VSVIIRLISIIVGKEQTLAVEDRPVLKNVMTKHTFLLKERYFNIKSVDFGTCWVFGVNRTVGFYRCRRFFPAGNIVPNYRENHKKTNASAVVR